MQDGEESFVVTIQVQQIGEKIDFKKLMKELKDIIISGAQPLSKNGRTDCQGLKVQFTICKCDHSDLFAIIIPSSSAALKPENLY